MPAAPTELVGIRNGRLLDTLAKMLRATQPDIVDVHGTEFSYGQVTPRLDVPVIVTLQGVMADIMPRYFADLGMARALLRQTRGWRDLRRTLTTVYGYLFSRLRQRQERIVFRVNRDFVGRTEWDHGCQRRFAPHGEYYYCHRILRPEFSDYRWSPACLGRRRVLCVTSPEVYKGTHVLIEALHLLQARLPGVTLGLGGAFGTTGWGGYLRSRVRRHGLDSKVEFLNYLAPAQIAEQAAKSSVFVAPSFMENECIALAEAMRVGMPCVASAAGGMTSTVRDGHDGLHFRPGDSGGLAEQLARVLTDEDLATRLAENARQTALARHDPDSVVAQTLANYATVLKRRS